MMGMEEKTKNQKHETKEKDFPRLVVPHRQRDGDRLIFDVRKHRKQAGPTLSGTGALV